MPNPEPDEGGGFRAPHTPESIAHPGYIGYLPADEAVASGLALPAPGAIGFDIYCARPPAPPARSAPANDPSFRQRVSIWLEDADPWDDWPKVEAAILGVIDDTDVEDEDSGEWDRGFRFAAEAVRRVIERALGIEVQDG